MKMCEFLKSHDDIKQCSRMLDEWKLPHHGLRCKDWDLAHIAPHLGKGNILDMGSSDSFILGAATLRGTTGLRIGIDLRAPDQTAKGCAFVIGDLMDTGLPAGFFETITCLSVIEHNVDFNRLAIEVDRLLQPGGTIYITYDYWEPKIVQKITLLNMAWNILSRKEVEQLVHIFKERGLMLTEEIDWTLGEPVISGKNWGPKDCIPYTFGLLTFKKK